MNIYEKMFLFICHQFHEAQAADQSGGSNPCEKVSAKLFKRIHSIDHKQKMMACYHFSLCFIQHLPYVFGGSEACGDGAGEL